SFRRLRPRCPRRQNPVRSHPYPFGRGAAFPSIHPRHDRMSCHPEPNGGTRAVASPFFWAALRSLGHDGACPSNFVQKESFVFPFPRSIRPITFACKIFFALVTSRCRTIATMPIPILKI